MTALPVRRQKSEVSGQQRLLTSDALRARNPRARRNEQLLRVLTHNIALLCDRIEG